MTYEQFANWYDYLMSDAPYDEWCTFVEEKVAKYGKGKSLLDLGCGTGELSIRLAQKGFAVTGIDLSEHMLAVAQAKAEEIGLTIPFFQQDMRELNGFSPFDHIVCFCDSLNYLQTEKDVFETFQRVYAHLKDGGLFLFDVHSPFKIDHLFLGQGTFASNDEQVSYIWNCFPGEWKHSVEHDLTFFVKNENGTYERYDECHVQRTYEIDQYRKWLEEAGFHLLEICADFKNEPPSERSERIFFIAKK
ncbi:methyltransferase family protein [Thermolongibacillus altinsuensis]|uniref:Methyltransferase family protein n=1 Tax=Thermolongibacillus altinsuensis TaxID=575256 RepID=A0A4R1QH21_9BACL|nr:class I SAM-dependent methyltransferase [Thermolongibacillus altinsuensis]TCL48885.1 methyltransferase family protein [Thermolongibacillus altinsuensis]